MSSQELKVAVCLYADVQLLDFARPLDLLSFVNDSVLTPPPVTFRLAQLSTEPTVTSSGALAITPTSTYAQALAAGVQYDVLLVPGGSGAWPDKTPSDLLTFLRAQAPAARYVLSVCTGSWILQQAGLLAGRRATTNKSLFNIISAASAGEVEWVRRARWVVDGKFWTASGVAAGTSRCLQWLMLTRMGGAGLDMTLAFIAHVAGPAVAARRSTARARRTTIRSPTCGATRSRGGMPRRRAGVLNCHESVTVPLSHAMCIITRLDIYFTRRSIPTLH